MDSEVIVCPRCKPIGNRITRLDGARIGWVPEALYVGYLVAAHKGYKKPPSVCPTCASPLEKVHAR
jgi:rubrerythrin